MVVATGERFAATGIGSTSIRLVGGPTRCTPCVLLLIVPLPGCSLSGHTGVEEAMNTDDKRMRSRCCETAACHDCRGSLLNTRRRGYASAFTKLSNHHEQQMQMASGGSPDQVERSSPTMTPPPPPPVLRGERSVDIILEDDGGIRAPKQVVLQPDATPDSIRLLVCSKFDLACAPESIEGLCCGAVGGVCYVRGLYACC